MSKSNLGKATLDLDALVARGELTLETAQRLFELKQISPATGLLIALVCLVCGQYIHRRGMEHLRILALALGIGATAGLTGWFALEFGDGLDGWIVNGFATLIALVMAILFRSRFLAAIVPLIGMPLTESLFRKQPYLRLCLRRLPYLDFGYQPGLQAVKTGRL